MTTLKEYLPTLGNCADEIAASLVKDGIKGKARSPQACPLAVAIRQNVDNIWKWFVVKPNRVAFNDYQIMDYYLPIEFTTFIRCVDTGEYPELLR